MPDHRRRAGGDKRKDRKSIWSRRAKKPAPRHGGDQEPVTRWYGTENLPGEPQGVAPKPSVSPAPITIAAPARGQNGPPAVPQAAKPPCDAVGAANGGLPSGYPAAPPKQGPPAAPRTTARPAVARTAPTPAPAVAPPGGVTDSPARGPAPVERPPATRRPRPPPSRRKAKPPAPVDPPLKKGRHRTSEKGWAPARRRTRRRVRREAPFAGNRSLKRAGVVILAAAVLAAGFVGLRSLGGGGSGSGDQTGPTLSRAPTTTLLAGTDNAGTRVAWLALLSYDPVSDKGAVVYVPAHTAVEVPGRGLQGMGEALETGGLPLLLGSAESFLGIKIDHYLALPRARAEALFDEIGALTVDVPTEVAVAETKDTRRLLLTEGVQELSTASLASLLYTVGDGGDDVELGSRHLAFWDALLGSFADDPGRLRTAFRNVSAAADAAGKSDDVDGDGLALVGSLAALEGPDLTLAMLPVRQVSVGGAELYATDSEEIAEFVTGALPGVPVARNLARVQVLNGNGSPGIGEAIAERLVGKGFQIELSGNAGSFGHKTTKVITYDPSPAGQALAARARDLLGVGEVQVSGQGQGSVNLTIIVGKDFLRTR